MADDAPCLGCLRRDAWVDGYVFATGCSEDEAEAAFEQFLMESDDEDQPA